VQYFRSKVPRDIATAPKNNELSIGMVIAPENTGSHEHKQAEKHAAAGDKTCADKELKDAAAVVAEHTVYLPIEYVYQQVRVRKTRSIKQNPTCQLRKPLWIVR
jgi:hypothetical protein